MCCSLFPRCCLLAHLRPCNTMPEHHSAPMAPSPVHETAGDPSSGTYELCLELAPWLQILASMHQSKSILQPGSEQCAHTCLSVRARQGCMAES